MTTMNLLHWCRIPFFVILVFPLSVLCGGSSSFDMDYVMHEAETQVKDFQKDRQKDTKTLRQLHEKIPRAGSHLDRTRTAPDSEWDLDWRSGMSVESNEKRKPDQQSEVVLLRLEISKLRTRVEELENHRRDESSARTAINWLQQTVQDLRHEMSEMAASLNTSAALATQQHAQSQRDLLRSDVVALGRRTDKGQVERETNVARIQQLKRDVGELRVRLQEEAGERRKMAIQLDSLKEEFKEQNLKNQKKDSIIEKLKARSLLEKWRKNDDKPYIRYRHNHRKNEVSNLYEIVANLEVQQSNLLETVEEHQAQVTSKVDAMQRSCSLQKREFDQQVTNRSIEILESIVNQTESQTLDIQSRVNNITSSGIKKLHGSTIELFEALERLESNFDRTNADIRREMSKLDYNLSQTQSDMEEIRDRQMVTNQIMSSIKNDVETSLSESKKNHLRILLVQSSVLNRTLQNREYDNGLTIQEAKISDLEAKIQSLSNDVDSEKTDIETLHRQVIEKADEQDLFRWEKSQQKVRESILEFRKELPRIKRHQKKIESELEKFADQLPTDCSLHSLSGPSLIHAGHSPVRVFCDNQWLVFQRRSNGDQSFEQNWQSYKSGFGDVTTDFWLGNDLLHHLTTSQDYVLRINLWDVMNQYRYAEYSTFRVLGESDNYRLVVGGYKGNASDALNYHNGMAFSTPDHDNDASIATHCARFYGSGWWYNHCQYVNINGRFKTGMSWYNIEGHEWSELTKVEMKIKLKKLLHP